MIRYNNFVENEHFIKEHIQMANKHRKIKIINHTQKLKPQCDLTKCPPEWLKQKTKKIPSADQDTEKLEISYPANVNLNWYNNMGRHFGNIY